MFGTMKLSVKLYSGFLVVLVLLAILGATGFLAIESASDGFSDYRRKARQSNLIGRLQANMLMVRMSVKDFVLTGSEANVKEFNDRFAEVNTFIQEAKEDINNPVLRKMIEETETHTRDYQKAFEQVIEFRTKRNMHVDRLNANGPVLEQKLSQIFTTSERDGDPVGAYNAGLALRNLLLTRLYVMKFLETNTQADADRVVAEITSFQKGLDDLNRTQQNLSLIHI